jgi:hypothetical protein
MILFVIATLGLLNDEFYLVCVHALELLFEINGGCTVIFERRSTVNDSTRRVVSADFTFDLNTISYNTSS